tara:strand:+ start:2281 stop:3399 length:1119 start_codon:yes stop_codon:yes gene_type:complete
MVLEWKLNTHGEKGIQDFLLDMESKVRGDGLPIRGFQFLKDTKQMLDLTREIELEALRTPEQTTLHVGFQNNEKLVNELVRYKELVASGTSVIAYGTGEFKDGFDDACSQWKEIKPSMLRAENQWFLTIDKPNPILFIGWELSESIFGQGFLSDPGKIFQGFVSDDVRLVESFNRYLNTVELDSESARQSIESPPESSNSKSIIFLTQDKLDDKFPFQDDDFIQSSAKLCKRLNASAILYDLSAASYFVKPGPPGYDPMKSPPIATDDFTWLGRKFISEQAEKFEYLGVSTSIMLPGKSGFDFLSEKVDEMNAELVVIPRYFESPGLMDRLVGNNLNKFDDHNKSKILMFGLDNLDINALFSKHSHGVEAVI